MSKDRKPLIVFTDDVSACQSLTRSWLFLRPNFDTLVEAFGQDVTPIFIVTNTRRVSPQRASQLLRDNCGIVRDAIERVRQTRPDFEPTIANYCDASLLGQFPVETDVIAKELGPFSAMLLIPAYVDAGYITRDSVHYVRMNNRLAPAHKNEFCRDPLLGLSTSYLPGYIEEKTKGRIRAHQITRLLHSDLASAQVAQLMKLSDNAACVVDCESELALEQIMAVIAHAQDLGSRFLVRGSASVIAALGGCELKGANAGADWILPDNHQPGIIIVGSPLPQATEQLHTLLDEHLAVGLHVDISRMGTQSDCDIYASELAEAMDRILESGQTAAIYTSRPDQFPPETSRYTLAEKISHVLCGVLKQIRSQPGFLICKGAATSNDLLSQGLGLNTVPVAGQILCGHSSLRCSNDHDLFPTMPVIICGQNVGGAETLAVLVRRLTQRSSDFRPAKRA